MKRLARYLPQVTLAAVVVAALVFGATQAFARSTVDCTYDPPTLLGACTSNQNCHDMCVPVWHPDPVLGQCISGCCVCYAL